MKKKEGVSFFMDQNALEVNQAPFPPEKTKTDPVAQIAEMMNGLANLLGDNEEGNQTMQELFAEMCSSQKIRQEDVISRLA